MRSFLVIAFVLALRIPLSAQAPQPTTTSAGLPKVSVVLFDGIVAAGYVDGGAFLNFTGPSISLKIKNSKISLGMLPSLRIKEDVSRPIHNSPVMPTLGAGLTFCYKRLAIEIPVYYNAKSNTRDGAWVVGAGIGFVLKK